MGRFIIQAKEGTKKFGPHDSDGIKFFKRFGVKVVAVTADSEDSIFRSVGWMIWIFHYFMSPSQRRVEGILKIADGCRFAFIGDGYHDIKVFDYAQISYTTLNSLDVVKNSADIVLQTHGSGGALMLAFEHYLSLYDHSSYTLFGKGAL